MVEKSAETGARYNRGLHALAVTLTIACFPLIWVGGLVTTYDAGMAVPDWPGTYGWNMFAYPVSTWLFGPFDLLVEHSHRLLASLSGLLTIGVLILAIRNDSRVWFVRWCGLLLAAVISQGVLGGARVVLDQRTMAMIHGCTGPLFFAMATATAVMTSRWWHERSQVKADEHSGKWLTRLAIVLCFAAYIQLIMGAQLRHLTGAVSPKLFMAFVHMHLTFAALVLILTLSCAAISAFGPVPRQVARPARLLGFLVVVQIALGIGTWVVNYALPWQEMTDSLASYTISAKGYWESMIVTAHMATGSLIISFAIVLALRSGRTAATAVASHAKVGAMNASPLPETA